MGFKSKFLIVVGLFIVIVVAGAATLFLGFPRAASFIFSYHKSCRVLRVEPFSKALIMNGPGQANKFAIICDDGTICRSEDTGFAVVKSGDLIGFRGFPEFATLEEFGKCDHAQLIKIEPPPAAK